MPVILHHRGFRFFFFSNEGIPREPVHIHVRKGSALAKIWLFPDLGIADSYGFSASELREIIKISQENRALFERKWHEYFHD